MRCVYFKPGHNNTPHLVSTSQLSQCKISQPEFLYWLHKTGSPQILLSDYEMNQPTSAALAGKSFPGKSWYTFLLMENKSQHCRPEGCLRMRLLQFSMFLKSTMRQMCSQGTFPGCLQSASSPVVLEDYQTERSPGIVRFNSFQTYGILCHKN